ncbi:uncharacterized protein LOC135956800 [Calliphora vicina]|uniref:uncharacterized protein LOC135956800 n=1 Tax=Calliphora vicina TaxID=7373 RepID=UPI00325AA09C
MQNFDMNMDFLFALLPPSNFQMTDEQLVLWQHNAIFECECDNFINRRIEADRQERAEYLSNYAINTAIQQHGLQRRRRRSEGNENDGSVFIVHPPARRPHLSPLYYEVYEDAVAEAIRERGLVLRGRP